MLAQMREIFIHAQLLRSTFLSHSYSSSFHISDMTVECLGEWEGSDPKEKYLAVVEKGASGESRYRCAVSFHLLSFSQEDARTQHSFPAIGACNIQIYVILLGLPKGLSKSLSNYLSLYGICSKVAGNSDIY